MHTIDPIARLLSHCMNCEEISVMQQTIDDAEWSSIIKQSEFNRNRIVRDIVVRPTGHGIMNLATYRKETDAFNMTTYRTRAVNLPYMRLFMDAIISLTSGYYQWHTVVEQAIRNNGIDIDNSWESISFVMDSPGLNLRHLQTQQSNLTLTPEQLVFLKGEHYRSQKQKRAANVGKADLSVLW